MEESMNLLVLGSGGREHAICWKLAQSTKVKNIYCIPGNYGISLEKKCYIHDLKNNDLKSEESLDELFRFIEDNNIKLTVVGPEKPLVDGIVDEFIKKGHPVIGPDKYSSQLEGSKDFAKKFMKKFKIRTPSYESFEDSEKAIEYIKEVDKFPLVIKADGLAAGKGVYICSDRKQALKAIDECMNESKFGDSGKKILIEEFIEGTEISVLAVTDSQVIIPFVTSKDHKKLYENDKGPNTGGMGVLSPNPIINKTILNDFKDNCLQPTINGIKELEMNFKGIVFFGLIVKDEKCYVLEYNVRMGDPETQSLLPLLKTDLLEIFEKTLNGELKNLEIEWEDKYSTNVVMASENYPDHYERGHLINFKTPFENNDSKIFFAGVKKNGDENIVTDGGRVLSVTALDSDRKNSIKKAYEMLEKIHFKGAFYRKDIGLQNNTKDQ